MEDITPNTCTNTLEKTELVYSRRRRLLEFCTNSDSRLGNVTPPNCDVIRLTIDDLLLVAVSSGNASGHPPMQHVPTDHHLYLLLHQGQGGNSTGGRGSHLHAEEAVDFVVFPNQATREGGE